MNGGGVSGLWSSLGRDCSMVILVAVAGVVYFGANRGARCVELSATAWD